MAHNMKHEYHAVVEAAFESVVAAWDDLREPLVPGGLPASPPSRMRGFGDRPWWLGCADWRVVIYPSNPPRLASAEYTSGIASRPSEVAQILCRETRTPRDLLRVVRRMQAFASYIRARRRGLEQQWWHIREAQAHAIAALDAEAVAIRLGGRS